MRASTRLNVYTYVLKIIEQLRKSGISGAIAIHFCRVLPKIEKRNHKLTSIDVSSQSLRKKKILSTARRPPRAAHCVRFVQMCKSFHVTVFRLHDNTRDDCDFINPTVLKPSKGNIVETLCSRHCARLKIITYTRSICSYYYVYDTRGDSYRPHLSSSFFPSSLFLFWNRLGNGLYNSRTAGGSRRACDRCRADNSTFYTFVRERVRNRIKLW